MKRWLGMPHEFTPWASPRPGNGQCIGGQSVDKHVGNMVMLHNQGRE